MTTFKPSDLSVVSCRRAGCEGMYKTAGYLRFASSGKLEQLWWSDVGDCVWEPVPTGDISPKEAALGKSL